MSTSTQPCERASTHNLDLLDIYHSTKKSIKILLASFITIFLCTTVYIFFSPKIFETSAIITTTKPLNLEMINRSNTYKLSPTEALLRVAIQLNSEKTRMDFFKDNAPLFIALQHPDESIEQSVEKFFNDSIKLLPPEALNLANPNHLLLAIQYPGNIDGMTIFNRFINYAIQRERDILEADLNSHKNNQISKLKEEIFDIRTNLKTQNQLKIVKLLESDEIKRANLSDELSSLTLLIQAEQNNRILKLTESISIAQSAGLKNPLNFTPLIHFIYPTLQSEKNLNSIPLYLKGTKILKAELAATRLGITNPFDKRIIEISKKLRLLEVNHKIEILKNRSNTNIDSHELKNATNKLSILQGQNFDFTSLKLVNIYHIGNNTTLPVPFLLKAISGATLGLTLGLLLLLIYIYPNNSFFQSASSSPARQPHHYK